MAASGKLSAHQFHYNRLPQAEVNMLAKVKQRKPRVRKGFKTEQPQLPGMENA